MWAVGWREGGSRIRGARDRCGVGGRGVGLGVWNDLLSVGVGGGLGVMGRKELRRLSDFLLVLHGRVLGGVSIAWRFCSVQGKGREGMVWHDTGMGCLIPLPLY